MDICFVIDITGSMEAYIEGAKASINGIIDQMKRSLERLNASEDTLKFAVVGYRDHPPQEETFVTKVCDFTSGAEATLFLNDLTASGGGDHAEAVLDGIYDGLNNVKWREKSEKFLYLVIDAPPHGVRFKSFYDDFPDGCPCGYSEVTMLPQLRDMKIHFTILKINDCLDDMIQIFSQYCNITVFQPEIFKTKNAKGSTSSSKSGVKKDYKESVQEVMYDMFGEEVGGFGDLFG